MITSADWNATHSAIKVTYDDGTVSWVPDNPDSPHRQALAKWEQEGGGVIAPYVAPPPTTNEVRVAGIRSDAAYVDLFNRAKTATAGEIDAWFAANVTTLAQARGVLSAIVKLLATSL